MPGQAPAPELHSRAAVSPRGFPSAMSSLWVNPHVCRSARPFLSVSLLPVLFQSFLCLWLGFVQESASRVLRLRVCVSVCVGVSMPRPRTRLRKSSGQTSATCGTEPGPCILHCPLPTRRHSQLCACWSSLHLGQDKGFLFPTLSLWAPCLPPSRHLWAGGLTGQGSVPVSTLLQVSLTDWWTRFCPPWPLSWGSSQGSGDRGVCWLIMRDVNTGHSVTRGEVRGEAWGPSPWGLWRCCHMPQSLT